MRRCHMRSHRRGARHASLAREAASTHDEKAIDAALLQRVAELKAFRLVREGSDLQAVEGAEIADIGLLDERLVAGKVLVLAGDLLPELPCLLFRAAGGE